MSIAAIFAGVQNVRTSSDPPVCLAIGDAEECSRSAASSRPGVREMLLRTSAQYVHQADAMSGCFRLPCPPANARRVPRVSGAESCGSIGYFRGGRRRSPSSATPGSQSEVRRNIPCIPDVGQARSRYKHRETDDRCRPAYASRCAIRRQRGDRHSKLSGSIHHSPTNAAGAQAASRL